MQKTASKKKSRSNDSMLPQSRKSFSHLLLPDSRSNHKAQQLWYRRWCQVLKGLSQNSRQVQMLNEMMAQVWVQLPMRLQPV